MADPAVKLTPKQRSVLATLGSISKNEGSIAKDAGIRTTWPAETARKHCMALRKLGLSREIVTAVGKPRAWQATDKGRALLDALKDEGEGR